MRAAGERRNEFGDDGQDDGPIGWFLRPAFLGADTARIHIASVARAKRPVSRMLFISLGQYLNEGTVCLLSLHGLGSGAAMSEAVGEFLPGAVEPGLGVQRSGLFQCVQAAETQSVFAWQEGLGPEPAEQFAGDDAVLVVAENFLHTVGRVGQAGTFWGLTGATVSAA